MFKFAMVLSTMYWSQSCPKQMNPQGEKMKVWHLKVKAVRLVNFERQIQCGLWTQKKKKNQNGEGERNLLCAEKVAEKINRDVLRWHSNYWSKSYWVHGKNDI